MSGSGGRAVDGLWTGGSCRNSMGGGWRRRSESECPDPVDGRWTGCGRAGAAEIAWEEARDGGARANVRIRWTGGGRAVDGRELQK